MSELEAALAGFSEMTQSMIRRRIATAALAGVIFRPLPLGVLVIFPDGQRKSAYGWVQASYVTMDWLMRLEIGRG